MSAPSSTTDVSTGKGSDSAYVRPTLRGAHKALLLWLFCGAEFMDAFIASALFPAINILEKDLHVGDADITWAFSAYSATFAAFLLISGRVADVYSARMCFIVGCVILGAFSLGGGFVHTKIPMFLLRAFAGVGAAMTVPSALSLIVEWFPEPSEQAQAISFFGGSSALGNVFGIILGGIFVQWASWRWILWFTGIVGIGIAVVSFLAVPLSAPRKHKPSWRRLDLGAVSLMTAALILFVYAVTSGPQGWGSAKVIAPLIISIAMGTAFFIYEAHIDPEMAALPPRVWRYPNVPILAAVGLMPFFWWCQLFFQLMPYFQNVYHWSPIMSSVRFLPTGLFSGAVAGVSAEFVKYVNPKWTIFGGLVLEFIASLLLPFANTSVRYWSFLFPCFIIGTIGTMVTYTNANIAIFMNTPPEIAGIVGAIFNCALQMGIAIGLAVMASITTSVNQKLAREGVEVKYQGLRDSFWFTVAFTAFMAIMVLIFYKINKPVVPDPEAPVEGEKSES